MFSVFANDLGLANHGYALVRFTPDKGISCVGLSYVATEAQKTAGVTPNESDRARRRVIYDTLKKALTKTQPTHMVYETYTVRENPWIDGLLRASKGLLGHWEIRRTDPQGLWGRPVDLGAKLQTAAWRDNVRESFAAIHKAVALAGKVQGRGRAAEVLAVQGIVEALGFELGIPLIGAPPGARPGRLLGRPSGTKDDIIDAVRRGLPGYAEKLAQRIGVATLDATHYAIENHIADAAAHGWIATVDLVRERFGAQYDTLPGFAGVKSNTPEKRKAVLKAVDDDFGVE